MRDKGGGVPVFQFRPYQKGTTHQRANLRTCGVLATISTSCVRLMLHRRCKGWIFNSDSSTSAPCRFGSMKRPHISVALSVLDFHDSLWLRCRYGSNIAPPLRLKQRFAAQPLRLITPLALCYTRKRLNHCAALRNYWAGLLLFAATTCRLSSPLFRRRVLPPGHRCWPDQCQTALGDVRRFCG